MQAKALPEVLGCVRRACFWHSQVPFLFILRVVLGSRHSYHCTDEEICLREVSKIAGSAT